MKLREKSVSRIASVILAAVMAVSMVPAAFAAATDGVHHFEYTKESSTTHHVWEYNADGTKVDLGVTPCVFENGNPCACGNTKPDATDTSWCDHMGQHFSFEALGDGTHNVICDDCGETVSLNVACFDYNADGICDACNAEMPACDHMANNWKYVDNGDGTHQVICADCGEVVDEHAACVYTDGKCICGHKKVATDTSWCDHMGNNWIYEDLGNGTHNVVCADCGETVSQAVPCVYTDGKCVCGAEEQTVVPADPAEPEKPATPSTGKLDPSYGMGYRPVHQFFQAVRNYFRNLFHRA